MEKPDSCETCNLKPCLAQSRPLLHGSQSAKLDICDPQERHQLSLTTNTELFLEQIPPAMQSSMSTHTDLRDPTARGQLYHKVLSLPACKRPRALDILRKISEGTPQEHTNQDADVRTQLVQNVWDMPAGQLSRALDHDPAI